MSNITARVSKIVKLRQGQVITASAIIASSDGDIGGINADPDSKTFFQLEWIGNIPPVVRTGSFTANAVLRVAGLTSFTADAVLRKTATGSFTADAALVGGQATFTADAYLAPAVELIQSEHASLTGGPHLGDRNGATYPVATTPGNMLIAMYVLFGNQSPIGDMAGWNLVQRDTNGISGIGGVGTVTAMWWKIADGTETQVGLTSSSIGSSQLGANTSIIQEWKGLTSIDLFTSGGSDTSTTTPGVTITPTAGRTAVLLTVMGIHSYTGGTPNSGVTEDFDDHNLSVGGNPEHWIGHMIVVTTSGGSYDVNPSLGAARKWTSITAAFNP